MGTLPWLGFATEEYLNHEKPVFTKFSTAFIETYQDFTQSDFSKINKFIFYRSQLF